MATVCVLEVVYNMGTQNIYALKIVYNTGIQNIFLERDTGNLCSSLAQNA